MRVAAMRTGTLACMVTLAAVGGAWGQGAEVPDRSIQVAATGEVQATPDAAEIMLAVESVATTAQEAGQENAQTMQRVIAALGAAGVPRDSVLTRGYSVYPEYAQTTSGEPPRIRGYRASNRVVVKVPRIAQVGELIDVALGAGANRFEGVNFLLRDPEPVHQEALRRAVARARASAEVIAGSLGVRLGPVLTAATAADEIRPVAYARMEMAMAAPTPIQPGEQSVSAHVTIRFSIETP